MNTQGNVWLWVTDSSSTQNRIPKAACKLWRNYFSGHNLTHIGIVEFAYKFLLWCIHLLAHLIYSSPLFLAGQSVFGNFLKSEFSEENIEFWLACEDYKKTESDLLSSKAENIYKAFVHSDAVKQVSIKVIVISISVCKFSQRKEAHSVHRLGWSPQHHAFG